MSGRSAFARATLVVVVVAVVSVLGLSACGSPGGGQTPTTSPTAAAFAELPDSFLPTLPGVSYAQSPDSARALARTHVGETLSAFSGGIARDLVVGGEVVGGVQVYRFATDVAAIDYARFVPMMTYTFTGATPTPQKIGGKAVQVVDPVPGTSRVVVAWTAQDHVVILWAHDLGSAKDYAGRYILDSV